MRFAQIMGGGKQGGAELFFERMNIALVTQKNVSVHAFIRHNPERVSLLQTNGITTLSYPFHGRLDFTTSWKLKWAIKRFNPDAVMAWMSRAAYHAPAGDWPLIGRLGGYYKLSYYQKCSHFVGNTRSIVRWIREQGVNENRVEYLPNFTEDFSQTSPASRADLNIPEEAPLLLGLGRLHSDKGFDLLIKALSKIPKAFLLIAGEGSERQNLEALVRKLGLVERVRMPGWIKDPSTLLKAADVFVCSSRHEPLGNIVIEAFSAACPVVAVSSPGPKELLSGTKDGFLTPPEDPYSLAFTINKLLASQEERTCLKLAGRQRFEKEFTKEIVLATWLDYLNRVSH